ncbi:MAG: creatininase family protein [Gammaproteobacteria bacterium]|nr:creatininase family protein [Gammaproteobacteria bacterium]
MTGIYLQQQNWQSAEQWLNEEVVVVFPLGAAAKEHGPHLPMNTDAVTANWLAEQVRQRLPVVIAPLINASFYPAFVEYAGSISLQAETARDFIVESCLSLAAFGVKRFYVINNGVSTERPLGMAQTILQKHAVTLEYLRLLNIVEQLPAGLFQQNWGSHADEHETSLMLHIAPELVDMSKAVDDGSEGEGLLSRIRGQGIWSESGVYGQATLATADKGRVVAEALITKVIDDISGLIVKV